MGSLAKTALVLVDVQNDFCPGGTLSVSEGDQVIPVLNRWAELFETLGLPVVVTMDWHPENHCSFAEQGGPWPSHCVQEQHGSEIHINLRVPQSAAVFKKGFLAESEAYSGFDGYLDGDAGGETLASWLRSRGVQKVYVGGLATDYCVKATVMDALENGFEASLISDGVRAVNVKPDDGQKAIEQMLRAGAKHAESIQSLSQRRP